jgi:hypothetical protein
MATPATDLAPSSMDDAPLLQPVHQRLCEWVASELQGRRVRFEAPAAALQAEHCVSVHLMSLARSGAARGPQASPLEFALRFLVTVWGDDDAQAHEQLCRLAFAAMEVGDFEVDFEPLSWQAWSAFGVPPRPGFVLQLPLRKPRAARVAQRVRQLLQLTPVPMQTLVGRVLGPGDVALMEVKVTLLTLGRVARTDPDGVFRFDGVPIGQPLRMRVQARGVMQDLTLPAMPPAGQPWVVHMPL